MILLIDFFQNHSLFFGIVFGTIFLTIISYFGYSKMALKKPKRDPKPISPTPDVHVPRSQIDEVKAESRVDPEIKVVDGEILTKFKASESISHPLSEDANTSKPMTPSEVPFPTSAPTVANPIPLVEPDVKPIVVKKPLGKYHVLFRKSDEKWIVKRENSTKILRVLETQKEAISYATIKALTNNTTVVIHKKDGKIRRQSDSQEKEIETIE